MRAYRFKLTDHDISVILVAGAVAFIIPWHWYGIEPHLSAANAIGFTACTAGLRLVLNRVFGIPHTEGIR